MEEVPLLSHLTILSLKEEERIKAIIKLLPLIDEKIEKGIENSADSASNYSEPFWIYFRGVLVMVKESLSKQEESSIWLIRELGNRIDRIKWIVENDRETGYKPVSVMGKL